MQALKVVVLPAPLRGVQTDPVDSEVTAVADRHLPDGEAVHSALISHFASVTYNY